MRRTRATSRTRARPGAGPRRAAWLPSLNAVHAFEVAGRLVSFKEAAAELCVTPSAVSRQIKQLEDQLGVPLFVRAPVLELTRAGAAYLAVVQEALAAVVRGTEAVRATRGPAVVRLSCVQTLAANWLVPALGGLVASHPEIELQIVTGDALVDLAGGEADLAIRFGRGGWPGLHVEPLLAMETFPVCAPALARRLRAPRDIVTVPWLHLTSYPRAFRDWLVSAGLPDGVAENNLSFDNADLAFRAAERGLGVAMATDVLVAPYLAEKRLVRPFAIATPVAGQYYLVARADDHREPAVAAVRAFLLELSRA